MLLILHLILLIKSLTYFYLPYAIVIITIPINTIRNPISFLGLNSYLVKPNNPKWSTSDEKTNCPNTASAVVNATPRLPIVITLTNVSITPKIPPKNK